ncbi:MAG TPA: hypothetical protein ENH13_06345 [Euryarchaeota archaeon]|nr:hypothetical protein BMS3Abin16_01270 [archaeon BMS3Abin16]GBE56082.1 hypothetical protein BMS3Bbin16_00280 [archaeon BMS3Bbin16]HDH28735.1 hypothetical protein [Euryarchaeota archaeon]HDY73601.1 hypothetical protein [Euryarchaeota archaeon]
MDKKSLVVLALVLIAAAGLSYQVGVSQFQGELNAKEAKIAELQTSIQDVKAEAAAAEKRAGEQVQPVDSGSETTNIAALLSGEEVNCLLCHEIDQTKKFHVPQTIMKIDEREGKRRRTCVDCHGPLGPPWSADKQLTPDSELFFNASAGPNGVIEITNKVPHSIHKRKLDSGEVKCQDCHGSDIEMVIPQPDTNKGQILVCQNCKFHPEGGNYIAIHVELAGKKCTTCHTGGIIQVHQAKTALLGQV